MAKKNLGDVLTGDWNPIIGCAKCSPGCRKCWYLDALFPWLKRLDKKAVDLGTGKRMLVKGGKLDARYQITVPEDLNVL